MDLTQIFTIGGKPGLQKLVAQSKNGVIVESLVDGKRFPAYANNKISSLEDISIYTYEGDVPLKDVFKAIAEKLSFEALEIPKDKNELKGKLLEFLPDFDEERVYHSDVKKIFSWYNLLLKSELITVDSFKEEDEDVSEEVISAEDAAEDSEE